MPQIFKFGGYIIFFWSNENQPTEPIYVHIAEHNPRANSTKIWITKKGKALIWIFWRDMFLLLIYIRPLINDF